jgi:hypothetical protein
MTDNPGANAPRIIPQYNTEFVAQAMTEYQKGASPFALSKKYKVPMQTIQRWAQQYGFQRGATLSQNAREQIGEKVLQLVMENLDAEIAIVRQTHNQEWMDKQGAGDLALMYATIHDKNVHLLSSMQSKMQQATQDTAVDDDLQELSEDETWADSYDPPRMTDGDSAEG